MASSLRDQALELVVVHISHHFPPSISEKVTGAHVFRKSYLQSPLARGDIE